MIYALAAILLLFAAWILLMGIRAMWGSALGGRASGSAGITLDDQDASSLSAFNRRTR